MIYQLTFHAAKQPVTFGNFTSSRLSQQLITIPPVAYNSVKGITDTRFSCPCYDNEHSAFNAAEIAIQIFRQKHLVFSLSLREVQTLLGTSSSGEVFNCYLPILRCKHIYMDQEQNVMFTVNSSLQPNAIIFKGSNDLNPQAAPNQIWALGIEHYRGIFLPKTDAI